MGNEKEKAIEQLKRNMEVFISRFELVIKERETLKAKLHNIEEQNKAQEIKIKELEKKVETLQLAGAFAQVQGDTKESKQRINNLIKEINRCIAMLNN